MGSFHKDLGASDSITLTSISSLRYVLVPKWSLLHFLSLLHLVGEEQVHKALTWGIVALYKAVLHSWEVFSVNGPLFVVKSKYAFVRLPRFLLRCVVAHCWSNSLHSNVLHHVKLRTLDSHWSSLYYLLNSADFFPLRLLLVMNNSWCHRIDRSFLWDFLSFHRCWVFDPLILVRALVYHNLSDMSRPV